jgi:hypothetical protein
MRGKENQALINIDQVLAKGRGISNSAEAITAGIGRRAAAYAARYKVNLAYRQFTHFSLLRFSCSLAPSLTRLERICISYALGSKNYFIWLFLLIYGFFPAISGLVSQSTDAQVVSI